MTEVIAEAEDIHLHLGCADIRISGFINIDVRQTRATDLVADAWELSTFSNNSVTSIYTRHMLEHLEPDDAVKSLKEWHRVLKAGGIAHIVCPDLVFHAKQFLGTVASTVTSDQADHAMAGFYGWRVESRGGSKYDAHKWGYSFESLSKVCRDAGFPRVDRIWEGKDSEPWHLNVKAHK